MEILRGQHLVPLRRAGFRGRGDSHREPVQGLARAAQTEGRSVGLRARECAEAQSKDFGIIATEKGYNLYVAGNGGMKPQHAVLLAVDIDEETLVRYLDRFLMFYVRTADRLQRTASWLNNLEGGLEYLSERGWIEDRLGISVQSSRTDMAQIVGSYQCEWSLTLENPEKVRAFSVVFELRRARPEPCLRARGATNTGQPLGVRSAFWSKPARSVCPCFPCEENQVMSMQQVAIAAEACPERKIEIGTTCARSMTCCQAAARRR